MRKIMITSLSDYTDFLNLTGREYIDIYFGENSATLINNSAELFGMLVVPSVGGKNLTAVSCRFQRNVLQQLAGEGIIQFEFTEDYITASFFNVDSTLICEIKQRRQEAFRLEYDNKLQLAKKLKSFNSFNVASLRELVKITKALHGVITVENHVAMVMYNSRVKIYQSTDINEKFSITITELSKLMKLSDKIYLAQNQLGIQRGAIIVLATTCRGGDTDAFKILEEQKAALKCRLDFSSIFTLMNKIKFTTDIISLDFNTNRVYLNTNRLEYFIPIKTSNMQKAEGFNINTIDVPVDLLRNVLVKCGNIFELSKLRTCIRIEYGNIIIYL